MSCRLKVYLAGWGLTLSKPAGQTKSRSVSGLRMSSADSPLNPRKRLTRSFLKTGSLSLLRWINSTQSAVFQKIEKRDPIHNLDLYYTGRLPDYVVFFNNMRSHRKLGMLTPCEAEQQFELEKN